MRGSYNGITMEKIIMYLNKTSSTISKENKQKLKNFVPKENYYKSTKLGDQTKQKGGE